MRRNVLFRNPFWANFVNLLNETLASQRFSILSLNSGRLHKIHVPRLYKLVTRQYTIQISSTYSMNESFCLHFLAGFLAPCPILSLHVSLISWWWGSVKTPVGGHSSDWHLWCPERQGGSEKRRRIGPLLLPFYTPCPLQSHFCEMSFKHAYYLPLVILENLIMSHNKVSLKECVCSHFFHDPLLSGREHVSPRCQMSRACICCLTARKVSVTKISGTHIYSIHLSCS